MSSTQIDKILEIYKQLAQNPNLTSARITSGSKNDITIISRWAQRNLERRKKQKFTHTYSFDPNLQSLMRSFPSDVSSEISTAISEDETLTAILRELTVEGKTKQFIEIWDQQHLCKSYDLSAFDVHGDVYSGPTFSAFQWSPDNNRLLYIAEKKLPKTEPFYKQKPKCETNKTSDKEEPSKGTEYIYKPDWGEQLVGKHRSVVIVLNIKEDIIVPVDTIPDEYFPSQVTWAPNGSDIVGVAYKLYAQYLGLIFCTNRESYIFHLKGSQFRKLTAEGLSCRSPRFSPDGKYLVWLERKLSGPHHHVHRLMQIKWNVTETPEIIVDKVKSHILIDKNKKFYGLFNQNLPERCWSDDSKYLFFSTPQPANVKSYVVNLETRAMTEIENSDDSSSTILDTKKNYLTFERSSLLLPSQLLIGKFDSSSLDIGNIHLLNCSNSRCIPEQETLIYETEFFSYSNETVNDFNFTYFGKKAGPEKSIPLIVIPHGGPHSTFSNEFTLSHAVFALLGFGILRINYRGSSGMGGDNIEYILGKVGESDVLDCVTAVETTLQKYPWLNPEKVAVVGGSHGGFLAAHLSGQHPNMFKAVVMRNPVIDISANFSITDIPDWCTAETNSSMLRAENTASSNYPELIKKMLNPSPILYADKVKAPTLVALGSKDLRVPSSQGKLWYYRLCANNVKTKLHMYDDNHSLTKDEVEIDFTINTALWLMEHTK